MLRTKMVNFSNSNVKIRVSFVKLYFKFDFYLDIFGQMAKNFDNF